MTTTKTTREKTVIRKSRITEREQAKREFETWLILELANAVTVGTGSALYSFKEKVMKNIEHLLEKEPMGVSQWKKYGKKYGYWKYFIEKEREGDREKLAALCHEQWSGWMKYLFGKCEYKDGDLIIPGWGAERWQRQMNTKYEGLTKMEKDSDRKEADKILSTLKNSKEKG